MITLEKYGYKIALNEERGGSCIRICKNGVEMIRTPKEGDYEKNPFIYGTPLLFPPNRISGAAFEFEGRSYRFPVSEPNTGCYAHGEMHHTPMQVENLTDSSVEFVYSATEEKPYLQFPHAFTIRLQYTLKEDGLHQVVLVTNNSTLNMPVGLGFHTTFSLPFIAGSKPENVQMQLDACVEYERDMATYLPNGKSTTDFSGKDEMENGTFKPGIKPISRLFQNSGNGHLILKDQGVTLHFEVSPEFGFWMVYNGDGTEFLSVEPQTWLSNCPNAPFNREDTGFMVLAPNETKKMECKFRIEA